MRNRALLIRDNSSDRRREYVKNAFCLPGKMGNLQHWSQLPILNLPRF
jgi:hypothetical protein